MSRAFTLVETMVVIAILGIMAAIAVPNVLPVMHSEQLTGTTEVVASFVAEAQSLAMVSRRCVRVRILTSPGVATKDVLVYEKLNVFDCEDQTGLGAAQMIQAAGPANHWIEMRRLTLEYPNIDVEFDPAPSESAGELRYRPTGRLFSSDATTTDDDGVIKLTQVRLAAGNKTKKILFEAHGPICVLPRSADPPAGPSGDANDLGCPP